MNKRWLSVLTLIVSIILLLSISRNSTVAQTSPFVVGANLAEYQPPTGSECDINVPSQYSTIQAGINAAASGDTVCVGPGSYNENITVNKTIRLSGRGFTQTVINPVTPNASTVFVVGDGFANNVILEGFFIHGDDDGTNVHANAVNLGPFLSGATVRYNWIKGGNGKFVMRADSGQNNDLIQNNVLEGVNSPGIVHVIGVQGPSGIVDVLNNTFLGAVNTTFPDSGVVLSGFYTNNSITQNAFHVTGTTSILVQCSYSSTVVTENNFMSIAVQTLHCAGPMNAENNWWGDTDPSDQIWGLDYIPFALAPFLEYSSNPNESPVASAGVDQIIVVNNQITLDGSGSFDPDSDPLTYLWSEDAGNHQTGILLNPTTVNPSFTPTTGGIYQFSLIVNDGLVV